MSISKFYLQIALDTPLRQVFDYLPSADTLPENYQPGFRVKVPFRNKIVTGIILAINTTTTVPVARLKQVLEVLDTAPIWSDEILQLLRWTADYYHHPIGEVVMGMLPSLLRQGEAEHSSQIYWLAKPHCDIQPLKRAKKLLALYELLQQQPAGLDTATIKSAGFTTTQIRNLQERGYLETTDSPKCVTGKGDTAHLNLNAEQQIAVESIQAALGSFKAFLLEGVTGSGKTEVYLQVIALCLQRQQQALVLVPEISLTPQLLQRFTARFQVPIAVLHSRLTDRERLDAWLAAKRGKAAIIIGTRSAVVTPLPNLGVIIIDEEHDLSFKQQEGLRYCARDLALVRARNLQIPVVLGTATPALETLYNVEQERYQRLNLPLRAGSATPPTYTLVDLRKQKLAEGLSATLINRIAQHIAQGNQVLIFINRRGFAPSLMCHSCGWLADCLRCSAHMTLHHAPYHLHCHHCDHTQAVTKTCPDCGSKSIFPLGTGTERVEQVLQKHFPEIGIARIDKDTTQKKEAFKDLLEEIHAGRCQILIGTQMLAKGHHFPDVTLVGILDIDAGLFSSDFRASERVGQLLVQVAGRAGRAEKPGEVLIQTHLPEHPLLTCLLQRGYPAYAQALLTERKQAQWPPVTYMALLRADAHMQQQPFDLLREARGQAEQLAVQGVTILGPIPALLEKRAGRYRAQLLLRSTQRAALHQLINGLLPWLDKHPLSRKVRWSLDVDPLDLT